MKIRTLAALFLLASPAAFTFADITLNIDAARKGTAINPRMYGIFLEEIGHGVDGGLYAELIQNRGFEDAKPPEGFTYQPPNPNGTGRRGGGGRGNNRTITPEGGRWVDSSGMYATIFPFKPDDSLPYWSLVKEGAAEGTASLDLTNPLNEATPRSCKLVITSVPQGGRVGISNEGFCAKPNSSAIGIKEGEQYTLTFYAKSGDNFSGALTASLEGAQGGLESNTVKIEGLTSQWKQFKTTLTAAKSDGTARFVLTAANPGTLWFDMVSLFPAKTFKDRPNGLRPDIAQMLADLKPGFVRFPGGCVVESSTIETAYNWKNTIGPVEQRPEMWNAWDYRRTHGMGLYEYFQFIEDLGADPMYVAFAGQTCIYRNAEVVPMDQMGPIVQSYLDVVEYANGSPDTQWGKLRAQSGHPAPYNLKMIEIGNENNDPAPPGGGGRRGQAASAPATRPAGVYTPRYGMIYDALKAAHPEIQTIADLQVRGHPVEMIDDHHYADINWFFNNANSFDNRNRQSPPLYLGEVAVTSPNAGPTRGNLNAALAEGAYLMGAERNADVVKMISYAPLLAHVDGRNDLPTAPPPYWHAMVYHDSTRVFGTASYYLWKTFGTNVPTYNLDTTIVQQDAPTSIVGNVGVGTWGTSAEFKDVKIEKGGKTLYAADFAKDTDGWKTDAGQWSVTEGAYRQGRNANAFSYFGDESLTDYTLTLKARKLSGGEGFLIVFGNKDTDHYWWNLGAYGNTRHEIELNQAVVGRPYQGANFAPIEQNRWYDVKIEVQGMQIRAYLDGQLIHDVRATAPQHYFAQAGRDEVSGDLIVKVINPTNNPLKTALNIAGAPSFTGEGEMTILTSAQLTDNNSLDAPKNVVPTTQPLHNVSAKFVHEFQPRSFTLLRLKTRNP